MKNDVKFKIEKNDSIVSVTTNDVEERTIALRQQPVLLDCDVAALYNVKTKEVNQAVRNNLNKFPPGYIFLLNNEEKNQLVKNFDRFNGLNRALNI